MLIGTGRPAADNGTAPVFLSGDDRDMIELLLRLGFRSVWTPAEWATLGRLWRLFGGPEGSAARPSPREWR